MIAVLTHHWARPEAIEEARQLLDRNGEAQRGAPGFGTRVTLYSQSDDTKITTLVTWDSSAAYDAWKESPERETVMKDAPDLWGRPTESERFDVAG